MISPWNGKQNIDRIGINSNQKIRMIFECICQYSLFFTWWQSPELLHAGSGGELGGIHNDGAQYNTCYTSGRSTRPDWEHTPVTHWTHRQTLPSPGRHDVTLCRYVMGVLFWKLTLALLLVHNVLTIFSEQSIFYRITRNKAGHKLLWYIKWEKLLTWRVANSYILHWHIKIFKDLRVILFNVMFARDWRVS